MKIPGETVSYGAEGEMRANSQAKGPELDEKLWKDVGLRAYITEEAISPIREEESFRYQDGDAY